MTPEINMESQADPFIGLSYFEPWFTIQIEREWDSYVDYGHEVLYISIYSLISYPDSWWLNDDIKMWKEA